MTGGVGSLSIEQLRSRFFVENSPYWTMYNASRREELVSKFRDDEKDYSEREKLQYSWIQLEELFEKVPYGYCKIVMKRNPNDNSKNSPTYYVNWGIKPDQRGAGIGNTAYGSGNTQNYMFEQILAIQKESYERQLDLTKSLLETKFNAELLESQIEGMGAAGGIKEELLKGLIEVGKSMFMAQRVPQAQLGTLGANTGNVEKPEENTAHFSLDQAIADIQVIKNALPQYNTNKVLRALAVFASSSPDQASTYIGMLISQTEA